ncbi:hypothetical protein Metvu_0395 [Methanocaldococcus vulcanius M7]|uniref:Uncharacterized protein n=1 Tax=Methanocaldococcus vulcanius (strain ATCC 700851 / DSM 12094 / M7) TaxID=579137 RepID=C9RFA6_METVM|nr:hypothetical protein [Methanocaldococcus vulcanius]ACX72258.1 hypothetical protein Metvu_0395 [Methanocaldococcus vulcanius M7]
MEKIEEIRNIALNVFIIILAMYIVVLIYTYLQTYIPYNMYYLEYHLKLVVEIFGIIVVLLYIPKLKDITYSFIKEFYNMFKKLSTGQIFVVLAILLLIYSAISLAFNREDYANAVAILSYYFLTFGVLNEFFDYILEKRLYYLTNTLKTFISLILIAIMIHYTPNIKEYFSHLDILIAFIAVLYLAVKLKKLIK